MWGDILEREETPCVKMQGSLDVVGVNLTMKADLSKSVIAASASREAEHWPPDTISKSFEDHLVGIQN